MRRFLYLAPLVLAFAGAPTFAQPVPSREPSSTHIFPAGGRRGTSIPVRVGAECLPPGASFHVYGEGVSAPALLGPRAAADYEPSPRRKPLDADGGERISYPKEWQSQMAIAADAPLGAVTWRVTCGFGGTQPRPFLIGDLPEFIENEPNTAPEQAQRLTLPVTVNGQIAGERDVDCYTFAVKAGEVVVCDVLAARLGSPLEPAVELRDTRGRRMPVQELRVGHDPVLALRVPADGDYMLTIAHLGYRGGPEYVYRLNLTTAPYVPFAFPPAGGAGETREIEFSALTGTDSFRTWKGQVTFPRPSPSGFAVHGVPLEIGDEAELIAANNDSAGQALVIAPPVSVSGRLLTANSEGSFRFRAKKDEGFTITCRSFPATSSACPALLLADAAGRPLAKTSAAEAADRRCLLDWRAPAEGEYTLRVRDLQYGTRGGPDFIYRLSIRPAEPDFSITLATDYVNVVQNGRSEVDGVVQRTGGFAGPIELSAAGVPVGVKCEPASLAPGQTAFKLVLIAADDARPTSTRVRLTGEAKIAGRPLRRVAAVTPIGGRHGVCATLRCDALHVTVQHKPVFRLNCNEAYQYAHRGTVHAYNLEVERMQGFAGPIEMQICDRQVQDLDGIEVIERTIPPGAKEFDALVYLPETMHANVQHHCRPYVQGYATFIDRWGQKQAMLAVCEKRCMIRTMPPVVKLKATEERLSLRPGGMVSCPLVLERTANFTGPMDVELLNPPPGVSADKLRIEPSATRATVTVRAAANVRFATATVRFRATGTRAQGVKVISEAEATVSME
jgi:hypothetical protein